MKSDLYGKSKFDLATYEHAFDFDMCLCATRRGTANGGMRAIPPYDASCPYHGIRAEHG